MASYIYPNDGKLHTRYSELVRATPGQMERLLKERYGIFNPSGSYAMDFGSVRHEQFDKICKETGHIPEVFREVLKQDLPVTASEYEGQVEIKPGIVIHFTIDAFRKGDYVGDFKTTCQPTKVWGNKKQLKFYGYMLHLLGMSVKRIIYFIERWDPYKEHILEYDFHEEPFTPENIAEMKEWTDERIFALQEGIKFFEEKGWHKIEQTEEAVIELEEVAL